jgi:hypothetical protein
MGLPIVLWRLGAAIHWSLSWVILIQSTLPNPIYVTFSQLSLCSVSTHSLTVKVTQSLGMQATGHHNYWPLLLWNAVRTLNCWCSVSPTFKLMATTEIVRQSSHYTCLESVGQHSWRSCEGGLYTSDVRWKFSRKFCAIFFQKIFRFLKSSLYFFLQPLSCGLGLGWLWELHVFLSHSSCVLSVGVTSQAQDHKKEVEERNIKWWF